ncbi:MAG: hypothetical protein H0V88_12900 [Pyrinomonadaceae bacterium]|nr:hypothetical protein [Pyrinomonadaceae bacterium]
METIEHLDEWRATFARWRRERGANPWHNNIGGNYPFVENERAPFVPLRRALPLLNLALITSAGAYIDGTDPFDTNASGGDASFREIPTEIEAEDLRYSARGYNAAAVKRDMNAQIPLQRLFEFESNGIIGGVAPAFWSFCGFIPDASLLASQDSLPRLVERVRRYEAQAALLIPASRLCHQTMSLAARALESSGIPTMMLAVEREIPDVVRPPRAGYYAGEIGSVVGASLWPEHQRRVLDEALRTLETADQPGVRKLVVDLETQVEKARGER